MHLELQFNSEKLLQVLRNRIKEQRICLPDPVSVEFAGTTVTVYIDHIVISEETRLERVHQDDILVYGTHHVSGYKIQIVQPITIYLATYDELLEAGEKPLDTYHTFDYEVVFDLFLRHSHDGWVLHADFSDVRPKGGGTVPQWVKQSVRDKLGTLSQPAPLDLSALSDLTKTEFQVAEGFVGSNEILSCIAIRLEQKTSHLEGVSKWKKFLKGEIEDNLGFSWTTVTPAHVVFDSKGKPIKAESTPSKTVVHSASGDWSLFLDFGLIRPAFVEAIVPGIPADKFFVDSEQGVDVTWSPVHFQAAVGIKFSGTYHTPPWGIDVGVDVDLGLTLYIDDQSRLAIAGSIDYSVDPADEVAVAFLSGLIFAIGGAIIGALAGGPIGAAIGAAIGFVVGFVGTLIVFSEVHPPLAPPHSHDNGDGTFDTTWELDFPSNPLFGSLTADQILGPPGGPVFLGALASSHVKQTKITDVKVLPLGWVYHDPCGAASLYADGEIVMSGSGTAPLHMCQVTIPPGTDPYYVLNGHITTIEEGSVLTVDVSVNASDVPAGYLNAPYPFQLLLQTTGGTRLLVIPALQPLTADQQMKMGIGLVAAKANCAKTADAFWSATGRFNLKWTVDPGPDGENARLWQVGVTGLDSGDTVVLQDSQGAVLAHGSPNASGFLRVEALTEAGIHGNEIAVVRQSGGRSASSTTKQRRLMLLQTALKRTTALTLRSPVRALEAGILMGTPVLFCMRKDGVHELYDVTNPYRPKLRQRIEVSGVRGAVRWRNWLVLWGQEGLRFAGATPGSAMPSASQLDALPRGPVREAHVEGQRLHVVSESGAHSVFDAQFRLVAAASLPRIPPRSPASTAGWLGTAARVGRTLARLTAEGGIELWTLGQASHQD